ncbi:MAG: nucleotidyltransferase domain-containing protein [Flavobacteriales bacterium]|nr:nucleotidyltransferase domain-containing protein [Flavobacteriales bacterium]
MEGDSHILKIVRQKKLKPLKKTDPRLKPLLQAINLWADGGLSGTNNSGIKVSGSTAKGTALKGKADLDLLISLKNSKKGTLKKIYYSLYDFLGKNKKQLGISKRRKQNVSIRIYINEFKIDLVPAKKQPEVDNWHTIYVRKGDKSRTQTNIDLHIEMVKKSGRETEILATKIWRDNYKLDFPSIYLELIVLETLYGKGKNQPALNFTRVLEYLSKDFVGRRVLDPGNSNNIISKLLTKTEKLKIAAQAKRTLKEKYWVNKLW